MALLLLRPQAPASGTRHRMKTPLQSPARAARQLLSKQQTHLAQAGTNTSPEEDNHETLCAQAGHSFQIQILPGAAEDEKRRAYLAFGVAVAVML